jgi:hypothetical protein
LVIVLTFLAQRLRKIAAALTMSTIAVTAVPGAAERPMQAG